MKWIYFTDVVMTCGFLGASVVAFDSGLAQPALIFGLLALVGFVLAYQIQIRFLSLEDV